MVKMMEDYQDRFTRCGGVFTAALFYSSDPISQDSVKRSIRSSDHIHILEENLFLVIFEETPVEGGIVASEKLLSLLLHEKKQLIYVAVSESEKGKEGTLLIYQLFNILEFAIKHQHGNEVLDSGYLDGIF